MLEALQCKRSGDKNLPDTANYKTLLDALIKAEVAGTPRHELILDLGETPQVLLKVGFQQRRLILKGNVVGKIFFDHAIPQGQIERLPSVIASPKAIYRSATRPQDTVVVMTFDFQAGDPVAVFVRSETSYGREIVNEIVSMYGKSGPDPEAKWTRDGLCLWAAPRQAKKSPG